MSLLKSDLKISAGLLKESAPENHLLAYITPGERDMLVQAGGIKTPTLSGIFAYPPGYGGDYQGSSSGSSSSSSSSGSSSGSSSSGNGGGWSPGAGSPGTTSTGGNVNTSNNNNNQDSDETSWSAEDHGPTGWSGDSGTDAWESEHGHGADYQGTQFTGGTYATDDNPASRTLSYGDDAATEDMGRPDITYFEPTGTRMGDYKSKYELNHIKYIQDTKLQTVKNKLNKAGFDIPKDANFQTTIDFVNNLSSDELAESYKDLKNPDGTPFYDSEFPEGYIPMGGQHKLPGVTGLFVNAIDRKPLTKDELLFSLNEATEVGKSGGGAMDWQERMKTYSPNQYANMTGQDYNPRTKKFTMKDGGGNEQDAYDRVMKPYEVGQTELQESQAAKWYDNLGGGSGGFNLTTAYATAKTKVAQTLQNKGAIGMLAVNQSPFYDWLKTNKLDKGIL